VGAGGALLKVCVYGLWHLGCVTAACLAHAGHDVIGLDDDAATIAKLQSGQAPLFEPGLDELIRDSANLRFTTDADDAARDADVLWITFDTPVDEDDRADVAFVTSRIEIIAMKAKRGVLVIVSSQLPVGTIRALESRVGRDDLSFASLPENLRLGKAIEVFTKPDRVVAGTRDEQARRTIAELLAPFTDRIEWMSVESAEMTKHALNAFLATSVVFINEIAVLCEQAGADAKEVERGLKSESRIGPRAYLSPGSAFAGGTLARDIAFLSELGASAGRTPPLIASVKTSNDVHKQWTRTKLQSLLGDLRGRRIAVWGLTYKPGTDTLRRSSAVELCRWLVAEGVSVRAHDPAVKSLPEDLPIELSASAADAARDADAVVVATEWPEYRSLQPEGDMTVVDPNRFLREAFDRPGVRYVTIGKGTV
jgi:UDPglucose 6-dehydrogenase